MVKLINVELTFFRLMVRMALREVQRHPHHNGVAHGAHDPL
jgi:hypothetical protein